MVLCKKIVLLSDDDRLTLKLFQRFLEKLEDNFALLSSLSPAMTIEILSSPFNQPYLIVTDLQYREGDLDGLSLVRGIRKLEKEGSRAHTPILVISGSSKDIENFKRVEGHYEDLYFMEKPVRFAEVEVLLSTLGE